MVDLVEEEVYDQFNISFDLVFVSQKLDETVRGSNGFGSTGGFSHVVDDSSR